MSCSEPFSVYQAGLMTTLRLIACTTSIAALLCAGAARSQDYPTKRLSLNQETARVQGNPDVKDKLFNSGMEVVANSPENIAVFLKSEIAKWTKVVQKAGIRDE